VKILQKVLGANFLTHTVDIVMCLPCEIKIAPFHVCNSFIKPLSILLWHTHKLLQ